MIDLSLLKGKEAEFYKTSLLNKEPNLDINSLLLADELLKEIKLEAELLSAEKNKLSQPGLDLEIVRTKSIEIGQKIKDVKVRLDLAQENLDKLLLCVPNFSCDKLPIGNKESNLVVRSWGEKPSFSFEFKNHVELNQSLKWFDFQIGTQIAESGFIFYNEQGTKLLYALTRLMLRHNKKWGFTPVLPPYVVSEQSLWRNGSLPKFKGDFYELSDNNLCLTPTAEVCLTNYHAEKIYSQDELPLRNCAWTSCFRREAGGYGASERGLIRIHQFEKVELFSICEPDKSSLELEKMVACGEEFLKMLEIPHQVSLLATEDCSFASYKTYDIEVWLPGQNKYYEVSSCSNCTDYQARRAKIRFKKNSSSKPEYVHCLNASSLAIPRLMVALMENFQTATGEVILPKILQDEMDLLW